MTPAEFVRARLDEKERADWHVYDCAGMDFGEGCGCGVPERTRREVEAGRAILDEHKPAGTFNYIDHGVQTSEFCAACGSGDDEYPMPWPCRTVRILATIDSDHPDYRPEWKP
jgi:hypothetical protein